MPKEQVLMVRQPALIPFILSNLLAGEFEVTHDISDLVSLISWR